MVLRLSSNFRIFSFSAKHRPALKVNPNSIILFEVRDATDGQLNLYAEEPLNLEAIDRSRVNPATGPVWIEGALPGQTLEVDILDVKVGDRGHIGRKVLKIVNGFIEMGSIRIPVKPVIGVIGVAPPQGEITTKDLGDYGGNLDTPDITIGSKVFLPIGVEGALLAMGDVHAAQGDGEVSGQGLEIPAEIKVKVKLHEGYVLNKVLVETESDLIVLASSETIDKAVDEALNAAKIILKKALDISDREALELLSLTSDLGIAQIVNPKKTVKVKIPKNIIPIKLENLLKNQ